MFGPFDCLQCLVWLIVGGVAGTVAGQVVRGRGFGPAGDIVLGLIGSVIGGVLFSLLGIRLPLPGICVSILSASAGAIVLVLLVRAFLDKNFAR